MPWRDPKDTRRPDPPPGYVPFKMKTVRRGTSQQASICPNCGAGKEPGSKWGFLYFASSWTDPGAGEAYEKGKAEGIILKGAGDDAISYEGVPILLHWSRYGEGECTECGCKIWYDYTTWQHYYKPTLGQLSLFG